MSGKLYGRVCLKKKREKERKETSKRRREKLILAPRSCSQNISGNGSGEERIAEQKGRKEGWITRS